jgi:hypothetical protein
MAVTAGRAIPANGGRTGQRASVVRRANGVLPESLPIPDVVAANGSEWRAVRDNPGPLPGDGWVLGAKGSRGKPGDRGERGAKGDRGERGQDGLGVEEMTIADSTLMLLRSDGSVLSCDLMPVIERIYRQVMA